MPVLSWDDFDKTPLNKRDKTLILTAAETVAALLANGSGPEPEYEPESREPYQQLVNVPGGTSAVVYTVAGDPMWPLSVMCRLTCSAVVADRTVAVEYRDGSGVRFLVAGTQAVVQASGQQSFCWYPQAGDVVWPVEDAAIAALPEQFLAWQQQLAVVVWNAQVGDVLDNVRISARFDPSPTPAT